MRKKVLITGGSGLLGSRLSEILSEKGYEVAHLSRSKNGKSPYTTYVWDISKGDIEPGALNNTSFIIHLAGAGVADKRWTDDRKTLLKSSRIGSANLLLGHLKSSGSKIEAFISASAIGIYGFDTGTIIQTEERGQLGDDFLATLTKAWESVADQFETYASRVVKYRIGLVLSEKGGLLEKLLTPARLGLSTAFGDGEQFMSWIHIDDLARMFVTAMEQKSMKGVYNAVAPNPVTNTDFLKTLARTLNRPYILPNTPKFMMKLAFGELSSVITGGNKVSSEKIEKTGFTFQFDTLDKALNNLLHH
jgi:uncharacterized protein